MTRNILHRTLIGATAVLAALGALGSRPALGGSTSGQMAEAPFTQLHGHGAPIVQIKFSSGAVGSFIVDTGAEVSIISEDMVKQIGKPIASNKRKGADQTLPWYDAGGSTIHVGGEMVYLGPGALIHYPQIQVGALAITDASFIAIRRDALENDQPDHIDGILGMSAIGSMALFIDNPRHMLTFGVSGKLTPGELASLGMSDALPVRIGSVDEGLRFRVTARYDNGGKSGKEEMILDTGDEVTNISRKLAVSLGALTSQKTAGELIFGRVVRGSTAVFDAVHLDDFSLRPFIVEYSDTDRYEQGSLLGEDVYAYCDVLFDFPAKRMYLKPMIPPLVAPPAAADPKKIDIVEAKRAVPFPSFDTAYQTHFAFYSKSYDGESAADLTQAMKGNETDAARYHDLSVTYRLQSRTVLAAEAAAKSVDLYRAQLAKKPGSAVVLAGLCCALLETHDLDGAEKAARGAVAADPKSPDGWDALGQCLHRKAVKTLTGSDVPPPISSNDQSNFNAVLRRLLTQKPSVDAIQSATKLAADSRDAAGKAVDADPKNVFWRLQRLRLEAANGVGVDAVVAGLNSGEADPQKYIDTPQRLSEVRDLIKLSPDDIDLMEMAAFTEVSEPFVNDDPNVDYKTGRLWTSLPEENHDHIQAILDRLDNLSLDKDSSKAGAALEELGTLQYDILQNRALAAETLRHALDIDPKLDFACETLSDMMIRYREYPQLEKIMQRVVDARGTQEALLYLSKAQYEQDELDTAWSSCQAAYNWDKDSVFTNLAMAAMLMKADKITPDQLAQIDGYIATAERLAGDTPPRDLERQILLARGYYQLLTARYPAASATFVKVLSDDPTNTDALTGLDLMAL